VVLTTAPNDLLRRVHDRMPVLIPDGLEEAWLEAVDGPGLRALEPLMAPWDPAAWEAVKLEPTTGPLGSRPPAPARQDPPPAPAGRTGAPAGPLQLDLLSGD
jgi:putative SOS response-associated peptidase YedK